MIALDRSSHMSSRYRLLDSRRIHLQTFSREVLGQIDTYLSMGSIRQRCSLQLDCLTRNREEIFQQGRLGRRLVSNCLHIDERELEGHQLVGGARGYHLGGKLGIETLSRERIFAQNASCWLVRRIKGEKSMRNVLEPRQNNPKGEISSTLIIFKAYRVNLKDFQERENPGYLYMVHWFRGALLVCWLLGTGESRSPSAFNGE
jgi:hypothetical protein